VLFAVDEMPTPGLPNLTSYLAAVGRAGITLVLYAQAVPEIEDVYAWLPRSYAEGEHAR
jgi:hypothetical protein